MHVLAGLGPGRAPPAEHVPEEVAQVARFEVDALEGGAAPGPPGNPPGGKPAPPAVRGSKPAPGPGMPEPIVGTALVVVLEDVVGLLDLLEALLGGFVARIDVGMELAGQPAIGLLNLGLRGPPGQAQNLVVVAFGHALVGIIATPKLGH